GPFQWVSIAAVLIFLPPWFWDRFISVYKVRWQKLQARVNDWRRAAEPYLQRIPRRPIRVQPPLWSEALVPFFLIGVLLWVGSTLFPAELPQAPWLQKVSYMSNIKQGWAMFSPNVSRRSGWFVIPGRLRDGTILDLNRGGKPLTWAIPEL